MHNSVKYPATFVVLLALIGCANTPTKTLDASSPFAILELTKNKGGNGLGKATVQTFNLVDNNQCLNQKRIARFDILSKSSKTYQVQANKTVKLAASSNEFTSSVNSVSPSGVSVGKTACVAISEFIPEQGKLYEVKFIGMDNNQCSMKVLEKSTQEPPRDLSVTENLTCKNIRTSIF